MSRDQILAKLLERWDEARQQGREMNVAELCADQPDLCAELTRRIEALRSMDWLDETAVGDFAPLVGESSRSASLAAKPVVEEDSSSTVPHILAGRYRLTKPIAEGGFNQVWRAVDSALERHVAVKLTKVDCLAEARRVAQLRHQGIVMVHDVGNEQGWCFIVFDLVEGDDLAGLLRQGPLPWQQAVNLTVQIAERLQVAHEQGFIHRDIKPANILIDAKGQPVLADFGIAVTPCELQRETQSTPGTLAYMAPELLTDSGQASIRSDIWSLGIVLHEMLAGRPPFDAATLWELRQQILAAPIPPLPAHVPAAVAAVYRRCLERDPALRYASARAVAEELRGIVLA